MAPKSPVGVASICASCNSSNDSDWPARTNSEFCKHRQIISAVVRVRRSSLEAYRTAQLQRDVPNSSSRTCRSLPFRAPFRGVTFIIFFGDLRMYANIALCRCYNLSVRRAERKLGTNTHDTSEPSSESPKAGSPPSPAPDDAAESGDGDVGFQCGTNAFIFSHPLTQCQPSD